MKIFWTLLHGQVLIRLEQDQKVTEDARRRAEQDLAAQKLEVHMLQVTSPLNDHGDSGHLLYSIYRVKFWYENMLRISNHCFS